MYQWQNDHNASIQTTLKILELDPTYGDAFNILGLSYLAQGNHPDAIANLEKSALLSNRSSFSLAKLGYGYGAVGKRAEALSVAKELEGKYEQKRSSGQYVAAVYSGLGDKDKALEWLEKDFHDREPLNQIRWDMVFEPLRADPRFKDLLRRMGLPE
jgi:tetratricopeptide (TPR) repeat protein